MSDTDTIDLAPESVAARPHVRSRQRATARGSHDTLLEQMSAPIEETPALLKSCISAVAALGRLETSVSRSELGLDLALVGRRLDVCGSMLLDGAPVDIETVLCDEPAHLGSGIRRALETGNLALQQIDQESLEVATLRALAQRYAGRSNPVRSRALGTRERRNLVDGQRLVNDAQSLEAGLRSWVGFVERGVGDVEALLYVGAAHRRWLMLRPFTKSNVSIGLALVDALLKTESDVSSRHSTWTLPLAWRLSRFNVDYRHALAQPEAVWLDWWLGAIRSTAEHWLETLVVWEGELAQLRASSIFLGSGVDSACARVLCRPGVSVENLANDADCSRSEAQALIDNLVACGVLLEREIGRSRRFSHRCVKELLSTPSLHFDIATSQ